jgi:hypothetical protein
MIKLTYAVIFIMIFNDSPAQEGNGIGCGETELYIFSGIIKAALEVCRWITRIPILQP